ncbi:heme ABC exporter ATP-binding protein CcmA [Methylosinus sp. H3A]|uniref:heme ABC exporter ATP-binding protein CcmA n=1 Tax=Methylosinus sp. H3A TaxID=2785786 RepID=UPI0018C218AF|nr:heme ABC exporter ATP-binding protein CcmA [Methylosinus sp. H3A]MBG0812240.1 heme ABC exporter ATP-binding protein CcmA [Methylosinus sp. H3A]
MTDAPHHHSRPHAERASALRLRVEDLAVARGGRRVIAGLGFSLTAGEALIVTGRNGAGKSTLLRALAGLLPRLSGRVEIEGAEEGEEAAALLHYLAHADGLKAPLTARENLEFWAQFLTGEPDRRSLAPAQALERVGLAHLSETPVAFLSAGQKRRIALARLLVVFRPLWLLDEPTSALDAASRARLARLMTEHRALGGMIIAATHEPLGLEDARELALGANS